MERVGMQAVRGMGILLLLLLLPGAESHGGESLPPPGTWVRYTVELPTRLSPDEAFRPETPPSPTIRPASAEDDKTKKDKKKETAGKDKAPPPPPAVTFDRFVFTIRILASRSGVPEVLVEMGEGTHAIRTRVDAGSIPFLSGVEASLLHIPVRTTEEMVVAGQTLVTQMLRWTRNGREVRVWRSDRVPLGIVRIETSSLRLTLTEFGEVDASRQGRDGAE